MSPLTVIDRMFPRSQAASIASEIPCAAAQKLCAAVRIPSGQPLTNRVKFMATTVNSIMTGRSGSDQRDEHHSPSHDDEHWFPEIAAMSAAQITSISALPREPSPSTRVVPSSPVASAPTSQFLWGEQLS